jgi:hypothetical protein
LHRRFTDTGLVTGLVVRTPSRSFFSMEIARFRQGNCVLGSFGGVWNFGSVMEGQGKGNRRSASSSKGKRADF